MDEKYIEMAERFTNEEREASVSRAREALQATHPDFDGVHCICCGDTIPKARRKAMQSCCRCTTCQDIAERRSRLGLH